MVVSSPDQNLVSGDETTILGNKPKKFDFIHRRCVRDRHETTLPLHACNEKEGSKDEPVYERVGPSQWSNEYVEPNDEGHK